MACHETSTLNAYYPFEWIAPPCLSCGAAMYAETTEPTSLDYCAEEPQRYLLCPDCGWTTALPGTRKGSEDA